MRNFVALILLSLIVAVASQSREKYNFNSEWKLLVEDPENAQAPDYDDSEWTNVTTPHAWNEDDAFKVPIANLSTGIAWYRKHFSLPSSAAGGKVFLEFEGIRHGGEFFLNGESIGLSENGVMAFGFDVTSLVSYTELNVLAARISNAWDYREVSTNTRYQWSDQNFYANYGGINKNVYLHVTGQVYQTLPLYSNLNTTGVYIYATDIDVSKKSATVLTEVEVRNEQDESNTITLDVVIEDLDGKEVANFQSPPIMADAGATISINASEEVAGLNFWGWGYGYLYNVRTSILVNDTAIDVVNTRTGFRKTNFDSGLFKLNDRTLQLKGFAQRTTNEWPALGNSVPAWLSDFSNRLILEAGGSLVRWMHVTPWKQDVESLDRLGVLQAMPAGDSEKDATGRQWEQRVELMRDAIIYNRNNPSIVFYESGNTDVTEEHMSEIKALRAKYDPHGGRAAGSREMLDSTEAEYGGEMLYINKGARIPFFAHEYSRDEGLRKYWDDFSPPYHLDGDGPLYNGEDASEYNRNQDSHAIENVVRWLEYYENRPGTGKRVSAGGAKIIYSDSNTHFRGAENYRRSGDVDALRLPKDSFHTHKVMWNTWVDADVPAVHILGHWNYANDVIKNVTVVSTTPSVELFLNGASQGTGNRSSHFLHTFTNITFTPGELRAIGLSADNKELTSSNHTTAGPAHAIRLTTHTSPAGLLANGADIALIDVEVIDALGQRNPVALNNITFTLTGEATWRGGIAQGPDNYILSTTLPVENGVNRVLLRSTTTHGDITLRATADGLEAASVSLESVPAPHTGGLSTLLPGSGLPVDLSRGPTPAGESYVMSTTPLDIASVTSGDGSANSTFSFDDNEETTWLSPANLTQAWVTYTLKESSLVNRVVLKMRSWRSTRYAIQILVGEKVAWEGTTALSLGYVQLPFEEGLEGESVTIRSTRGQLGIVEAELYGPAEEGG